MAIHQRFLEPIFDQAKFGRDLSDMIAERGLSYRTASLELGVSHSTLHRVATGKFPPDVETYLRITLWMSERYHQALTGLFPWRVFEEAID